jgi:predicted CopG family antitoxin
MKKKLRRVQIDMPDAAYDRLEQLKEATEAASIAEVIRHAIELREAVVRLTNEGYEIIAEDEKSGKKKSLYLPSVRMR